MPKMTIENCLESEKLTRTYYTMVYFSDLHRWKKEKDRLEARVLELKKELRNHKL